VSSSVRASADQEEDGIDIVTLWRVIWKSKYIILLSCVVCVSLSVWYALAATERFRAEVVITEAHDQDMGGNGSSITGQLGGLASLAGLDMANNPQDRDSQGVLNSRRLIEEFIKKENLLRVLMPHPGPKSTLWFAVKRFKDRVVTIREDKRSNLTTVGIDWTDAKTAAQWANDFVALCNELVRTHALNESSRNIAYLNEQLAKTNVVDIQRALDDLIESEMKKLMLANGRTEYAFTIIDPAVAPEIRNSPQRVLVVIIGFALGMLIGIVTGFIRERIGKERSRGDSMR
jgi:uncharacterized protein involved in exopolysaccharide biosynthesis